MGKSIIITGANFADVAIPEDVLQTIDSVITGKYYRQPDPPSLNSVIGGYIANYNVTAGKSYRVLIDQSSIEGVSSKNPLGPNGCLVTWLVDGVATAYAVLGDASVYEWDFVVTVPSGVNGMAVGGKALNVEDVNDIIQVYEKVM